MQQVSNLVAQFDYWPILQLLLPELRYERMGLLQGFRLEQRLRIAKTVACNSELLSLSLFLRGRGGATTRSGFTTPPEPRRKSTRADRSADVGDNDMAPEPDAES